MPLPGSGQISIGDIATEFGGSTPHALSEYYRGGAYVPDTGTNAGVPTSGVIALTDFYSAAAGEFYGLPSSMSGYGYGASVEAAYAIFDIYDTGSYNITVGTFDGGITGAPGDWHTGLSGSAYEIRFVTGSTIGVDNFEGDPVNTWLSLGTSRQWYVTGGFSVYGVSGNISIRMAASPFTVLTTAAIGLTANFDGP